MSTKSGHVVSTNYARVRSMSTRSGQVSVSYAQVWSVLPMGVGQVIVSVTQCGCGVCCSKVFHTVGVVFVVTRCSTVWVWCLL